MQKWYRFLVIGGTADGMDLEVAVPAASSAEAERLLRQATGKPVLEYSVWSGGETAYTLEWIPPPKSRAELRALN